MQYFYPVESVVYTPHKYRVNLAVAQQPPRTDRSVNLDSSSGTHRQRHCFDCCGGWHLTVVMFIWWQHWWEDDEVMIAGLLPFDPTQWWWGQGWHHRQQLHLENMKHWLLMLLLLLCVHLHLGVDVVVNRGVHHGVYPLSMGPSHGVHPAYILASSGQLLTSRYQYHKIYPPCHHTKTCFPNKRSFISWTLSYKWQKPVIDISLIVGQLAKVE